MQKETVDRIVASLENGAQGWDIGEYRATHRKSGTSVWIANSYYGLDVTYGGVKVGGVTTASSLFGSLIPWRRRILRAIRRAADYRLKGVLGDAA